MKQNKMREEMINSFIDCLKKDYIPWHKSWSMAERPINAVTNTPYRGTNAFWLSFRQSENNYKDPRWCTFKQAQTKGWKIKAGSKGTNIEFWSLYDTEEKRKLTQREAQQLAEELTTEEWKNRIRPVSNTYTVFNGEQIEGIPQYEVKTYQLNTQEIISGRDRLITNMNVGYKESGDSAFYNPRNDEITLPEMNRFESEYAYMATLLHEAGHATGHESRLGRPLDGVFGSPEYAKEELRAEIASAFTAQTLGLDYGQNDCMENHEAYVQSWISVLENEPNELFAAIKDAEKISDYLIEKGEFNEEPEEIIDNYLFSGAEAARFRMAMKGQKNAFDSFINDENIPQNIKNDSLKIGELVNEYLEQGVSVKDIIMYKTKDIDDACGFGKVEYTKNMLANLYSKTTVEYMELKALPNLWNREGIEKVSGLIAEKLVYNHISVFTGKEELKEINTPKEYEEYRGLDFFANKDKLQEAMDSIPGMKPTVRCELSESEVLETGKTYTIKEYDELMRNADRDLIQGYRNVRSRYKTEEDMYNTKNPSEQKYLGYRKNEFIIDFQNQSITEQQNIGEGEGGIIEHFENADSSCNYVEQIIAAKENDEEFIQFTQKVKTVYEYEESNDIPKDFRTTNENMEVISKEMLLKQYDLLADKNNLQQKEQENQIMNFFKNSGKLNIKNRGIEKSFDIEL